LSGGSDNPDFLVGVLALSDGTPAKNARVALVPVNYNPVSGNPLGNELKDTTDDQGKFRIRPLKIGDYNLLASDSLGERMVLRPNIHFGINETIPVVDTILPVGKIRCIFSQTVNKNGYIFIKGTSLYSTMNSGIVIDSGYYRVMLENVPPGKMPEVVLSVNNVEKIISDTTVVNPHDSTPIVIDNTWKPTWRFPVIVGVSKKTAVFYGGFDSIKTLIKIQIDSVERWFNGPKVFSGIIKYPIDSFYLITGTVNAENVAPPSGFGLRLLYDGYGEGSFGCWVLKNRVICHSYSPQTGTGMFGHTAFAKELMWEFGLSRGCTDLYELNVTAGNNKVNGTAFSAPVSIMNGAETALWDLNSINVVNYYKATFNIFPRIIFSAFPDTVGIKVARNNVPVTGAAVRLFAAKQPLFTISDSAIVIDTTDNNGRITFGINPFTLNNKESITYFTTLIQVIYGQDTTYTWFPHIDAGNAWYADKSHPFYKEVTLAQ
jgi:hypothetical protein